MAETDARGRAGNRIFVFVLGDADSEETYAEGAPPLAEMLLIQVLGLQQVATRYLLVAVEQIGPTAFVGLHLR